jgi:hypothetical protein
MPTPIVVELLPERLYAAVFTHAVTVRGLTLSCRTVMSRGLRARGQRDVVLTRVAPPGESIDVGDAEVFHYLKRLFEAAEDGPVARIGAVTRFDVPFLGATSPSAVTYVEAEPFPEVPVDDDALAALVLHADEAAVAMRYGPARVLARLGRLAGYHPFPRWWDPGRESVAHPDDALRSALADVARVALPEGSLAAADQTVVLRLPADAREGLTALLDALPADAPCALLVPPEAITDASLVWAPGQEAIAATSANGRRDRVGGNFLLFAPGAPQDQGTLLEDGFAMRLRAETWAALRSALRNGRGVILDAGDGDNHGLRIEWVRAAPDAAPEQGVARLERVVFMQPEATVARAVSSRELSRYIASLRQVVASHLAGSGPGAACDLLLRVDLDARRRPSVNLGVRPLPPPAAVSGLVAKVEAIAAPAVRGPVGLQVLFTLHGGTGDPSPHS